MTTPDDWSLEVILNGEIDSKDGFDLVMDHMDALLAEAAELDEQEGVIEKIANSPRRIWYVDMGVNFPREKAEMILADAKTEFEKP